MNIFIIGMRAFMNDTIKIKIKIIILRYLRDKNKEQKKVSNNKHQIIKQPGRIMNDAFDSQIYHHNYLPHLEASVD